jgi:general secretion pathway protein D
MRKILIGMIGLMLLSGCQVEKPPADLSRESSGYKVTIPETSSARVIDPETAAILKRHSIPYEAKPVVTEPDIAPDDSEIPPDAINEIQPPLETKPVVRPLVLDVIEKREEAYPAMASFTEETPTCLAALAESELADKMITVNFEQAQIHHVLKTVSEITGIKFIIADEVAGPVTVLSPTQMRLGDLYRYLESILQVKGFAAIAAEDHVKIVPRGQAHQHKLPIRVGSDPAAIPLTDTLVTQIMPIRYADAAEISQILRSHVTTGSQIDTYPRTNAIIITDTSANIHHLARIVEQIDIPGAQREITVIPLQFASASVLSKQITEIVKSNELTSIRPRRPGVPTTIPNENPIHIQANLRINALVITANLHDTQMVLDLVRELDVEQPAGVNNVQVVYLKNAKAKEVAESLTASLAKLQAGAANPSAMQVHIHPDVGTNALIIHASPPDFKIVAGLIDKLDIVREQVLVELLIMEVSEDDLTQIGVDWATLDQAVSDSVRGFGLTDFGIRVDSINGDLRGLGVGAFKDVGGEVRIGAILGALQKKAGGNILSTPHILTSNHQEAALLVGENIPRVTKSRVTETDPSTPTVIKTIEYIDVGVDLKIVPHVSQGGMVQLEIDSNFSRLIESATGLSAETPTTSTRQLKTEISMEQGKTLVIGGLIRDDKTTVVEKIPLLGDLPLLGQLFRMNRDRIQKTNLLLFITPYVLTSQIELAQITQKKQDAITTDMVDRMEKHRQENAIIPK